MLLALACAGLLVPAATAEARVPQGFYGVNYSGNIELAPASIQSAIYDRLAQAGVESTRVLFNWDRAQRSGRGGPYDWHWIDRLVENASMRGMTVLPMVHFAPAWAKQYPTKVSSPPKSNSDYTAFLKACIQRYGPVTLKSNASNSFWLAHPLLPRREIHEWEIWNEPEISFHWWREPKGRKWGEQDSDRYVSLLRASYKAVHETDPGGKVVLAPLSIDSWKNLGKMYNWSPGLRGAFDIASLQAYAGSPSFLPTLMRNYRAVLNSHGAQNVPLYVTEMTWPAAKGKAHPRYTTGYMQGFLTDQKGAAARLTKGYKSLRSLRNEIKIKGVYWYIAASAYSSANEFEYSGLVTVRNNAIKTFPVYTAYQNSARSAEGCAKTSTGSCQ